MDLIECTLQAKQPNYENVELVITMIPSYYFLT